MNQSVSFIYLIEILRVIWQYYTHVTERLCSPFPGGSWIFSPHLVLLRDWTGSLRICPETIHTNYWIKLFPWTYRFLKTMARILSCVNFKLWISRSTYKTTRVIIADCLCISEGFQQRIGLQYHIFDSL